MRFSRAAVGLATLFAAAPAGAADPLHPTAKWTVNFDDAQCVASRNYGTEANPIYLVLKAPPLGSILQIGVIRRGMGGEARQIDGELSFDENAPVRTTLLQYNVQKLRQQAVLVNLPLQDLAPMRLATTLHIHASEDRRKIGTHINLGIAGIDLHFALSQMDSVLKTLDACVVDLRSIWNVPDPALKPQLRQSSRGDLQGVIRSEDYPAAALAGAQQGAVRFALLIDENGKIADCTVISTSGIASLDAQSCAIVKERAKFTPAIGLDGNQQKTPSSKQ